MSESKNVGASTKPSKTTASVAEAETGAPQRALGGDTKILKTENEIAKSEQKHEQVRRSLLR